MEASWFQRSRLARFHCTCYTHMYKVPELEKHPMGKARAHFYQMLLKKYTLDVHVQVEFNWLCKKLVKHTSLTNSIITSVALYWPLNTLYDFIRCIFDVSKEVLGTAFHKTKHALSLCCCTAGISLVRGLGLRLRLGMGLRLGGTFVTPL